MMIRSIEEEDERNWKRQEQGRQEVKNNIRKADRRQGMVHTHGRETENGKEKDTRQTNKGKSTDNCAQHE